MPLSEIDKATVFWFVVLCGVVGLGLWAQSCGLLDFDPSSIH